MKILKKINNSVKTRVLSSMYGWENIQTAFVTSTGRTGTMFFRDFFTENFENTKAVHEPWPDLHDIGYNRHHNKFSLDRTIDIIKRERSGICQELNNDKITNFLESNYNLSYLLPYLEPVFGEFKLVHVIREPKSYLKSIFSTEDANRHIYAPFDNRPRITAPDFPEDPYANQWENWGRFEKLCWHYYKVNTQLGDFVDASDNAITVKFDEIFKQENNFEGLFKIVDFIGFQLKKGKSRANLLSSLTNRANKTKKAGLTGYEEWTKEQKAIFHKITDPVADRFGLL